MSKPIKIQIGDLIEDEPGGDIARVEAIATYGYDNPTTLATLRWRDGSVTFFPASSLEPFVGAADPIAA